MNSVRFLIAIGAILTVLFVFPGCNQGAPQAAFSADVTSGDAPLRVEFTDESTINKSLVAGFLEEKGVLFFPGTPKAQMITSWQWDFGDGDVATDQNPFHKYTEPGDYAVSLTVTTNKGKTATVKKDGYITVEEDEEGKPAEGEEAPDEGEGESSEGEGEGEGETEGEPAEGEGEPAEGEPAEGEGESAEGEGEPDHTGDVVIMLPGDVPLALMHIPAGTFLMGRYPDEQDSYNSDEDPQHSVTLTQDFYLGKYELTKRQWQAVMGTAPWSGQWSVLDDLDSPAVYVSWNDAQDFVTALNTHVTNTGQGAATFRLPSEAEWEYACRAGTTTRFYWGDDPSYTQIGDYAWYYYNAYDVSEQYAHVVGLKLPNAFGLYDMSGNVWEWCQDWYGDYPSGSVTDPTGPASGSTRVHRGGSWINLGHFCRSAYRDNRHPTYTKYNIGFRVAR